MIRNQSVLQRGVNDSPETMMTLVRRLGHVNVHPYYVYVHDLVRGVEDLRTSVDTALHIEKHVRGSTAGFNTPTFVVDAPGGGGKRDAHSYEYYDRRTGISVYTAPAVKPGRFFYYFDPLNLLSPRRIVNPPKMDDTRLMRFPPAYRVIPLTPALDWSVWNVQNDAVTEKTTAPGTGGDPAQGFAKAVEMCNNNGHCRKFDAGTMCPSYRVTRDEQHLTRGRANTLRLALSGQLGGESLDGEAVKAALDLCVGCKGCKRDCPTGVDMARMKIEATAAYKARHGHTLRDRLIAHLPRYAAWASKLPWLFNLRNRVPALARLTERWLGFAAARSLPRWRRDTLRHSAPSFGLASASQVLAADTKHARSLSLQFIAGKGPFTPQAQGESAFRLKPSAAEQLSETTHALLKERGMAAAETQLDTRQEARRQVGFADQIFISKSDLVAKDEVDALVHRLKHMNPRAPQRQVHFGEVPIAQVFDLKGFNLNAKLDIDPDFLKDDEHDHSHCDHDHGHCDHDHDHGHEHHDHAPGEACNHPSHQHGHGHGHHHHHDDDVKSFVFKSERAFDPARLEDFLGAIVNIYGPRMLRYKGVLHMQGTERKVIFQGVHQLMGSDLGPKWAPGEKKSSKMVFIGIDLPKEILLQGLQQCVS